MNKKYRPIIKEGTHLAPSKETSGTYRGALLDDNTNKIVGQAEWELVEDDDDYSDTYESHNQGLTDEEREQLVEVVSALIAIIGTAALPVVIEWWKVKVAPAFLSVLRKIIRKDKTIVKKMELDPQAITTIDFLSKDIDIALEDYEKNMSNEDAQKHLMNIVILAVLLAREIRSLSGALITKESEQYVQNLKWKSVFEKLTAQNVTDSINRILAGNTLLIEESRMKDLSEILGYNLIKDGEFIPIKNEQFIKALALELE
ncbi:MAG TPA: hypothetical protein GX719_13760 [Gammaproteobacteria bacterium]|nr:hypothetical protein [Gammaproteobacteria bacterium]